MTTTRTETEWSLLDEVPERVVAGCLYDSPGWLRMWETTGIEGRARHGYVSAEGQVLPLYALSSSPFWHGYVTQAGQQQLGSRHVFAGSTYSMYTKRDAFPAALARGAHATAMEWIDAGEADLLIAPNLTDTAAATWVDAVGPPVGRVLLDRTYSSDLSGDFDDHLGRLPRKLRMDVQRRLRRAGERGLRIDVVDGPEAHGFVPAALPLVVGTTDEHGWPALYDEDTLHALLRTPGALLVVARVEDRVAGVFFGFRQDAEVTFLCGGVDYSGLTELSTYVAMMYRCTEWAYAGGFRRIEWGRDNYRFKERHGLVGTDLWALVYSPDPTPALAEALAGMHRVIAAYVEGSG
ncbi:GNAT family N-acetyltransferase [Saccharothrix sp. 6-C]|uniref:GNAT family N-acetyltransferase n=1 Tax=Saccharothrix sp. 6-C TaxID=2781735 RepID=UPI00191749B4|nr:GNAT family N-acetyltransferase [Saccharothrix sp. 6-C]QQQ79407.1 GNAT family N-acetyltransferase [Saccharothrix sp. 6-C]